MKNYRRKRRPCIYRVYLRKEAQTERGNEFISVRLPRLKDFGEVCHYMREAILKRGLQEDYEDWFAHNYLALVDCHGREKADRILELRRRREALQAK